MRLNASDDDRLIEDAASRFLRDRSILHGDGNDTALWAMFAEMGWCALPIPEAAGGLGGQASTVAVLVEALGHGRVTAPYLATVVHAAGLLAFFNDARAFEMLGRIASGETRVALLPGGRIFAEPGEEACILNGKAELVLGGDRAELFLVPVDESAGLFLIPADTAGLSVTPVIAIDGRGYADVRFDAVKAADPLTSLSLDQCVAWAEDRMTAMLCADALGAIRALMERTIAHSATRVQFGRPLQSFQVVEHMIADMAIGAEEARAAMQFALAKLDGDVTERRRAVSAAKVKIGAIGRAVANIAIQIHGAMGVTEELDVGSFAKRLLAFDVLGGTAAEHLARYMAHVRGNATDVMLADRIGQSDASPTLVLDAEYLAFRVEIAAYLDTSLPCDISRGQQFTTTVYAEPDIAQPWQDILHQSGRSAPNWPARFGGTGWDPIRRYIWAHETARRFAPFASPIGLPLVGPVLMHYGTADQQARFLPPIAAGTELWCQGFSEPSAGSDLAGLATRATRNGAEYVVNGTKIWTTHGHFAHFMAALVRTDPASRRRDGISFLIIDMNSPGIEIRPIVTIGGDHEVNQVFFDDVRVPVANLVGGEGQGWEIAKFLLEYERGGDIMSAGHRALIEEIRVVAIERGTKDDAFWRDFASISIDIDILEILELRVLLGAATHDAVPSILKLRASEIQQAVTGLGIRLLGRDGLRWIDARPLHDWPGVKREDAFLSRYLNSRANTIFGGAREIQKTIIAKTVF